MPPVSPLIAYSLSLFAAGAIICQIFAGQGETDLRYYELMMVVPQMDEEGLSATLDRVNNDIGERGGTVVRQQRWGGLRRLAYPINDQNEGNYVLTHLELDPESASELEANLRVSENILRHLLLRIDSIPEVKETPPQPAPVEEAPVEAAAGETPAAEAETPAAEAARLAEAERRHGGGDLLRSPLLRHRPRPSQRLKRRARLQPKLSLLQLTPPKLRPRKRAKRARSRRLDARSGPEKRKGELRWPV